MILILDNNEYRRRDIYYSLYIKKCIVSAQPLDDMEYCTKPNLTAYINPSQKQVNCIKQEDTISIVATNKKDLKVPNWIIVIPLDKYVGKTIYNIFNEKVTHGKGREIFGIACLEGRLFTLGGACINVRGREAKFVKFFLYNSNKKFFVSDVCTYFDFIADAEEGFICAIRELNTKCKLYAHRIPLISNNAGYYYVNPEVLDY